MTRSVVKDVCKNSRYDAVVIGSGPNGLACAIAMIRTGASVLLVEGQSTAGGGCRTLELTIPGFKHDVCSAVHPLGIGSPFFRTMPLEQFGLKWINPEDAYIHGFEPGKALVVQRDLSATAQNLGKNGESFTQLIESLLPNWDQLCDLMLHPLKLAGYPLPMARFGTRALLSARQLADWHLTGAESKAVFAGVAAHSATRLDAPCSASVGLALSIAAHAVGWPIPEGGAQSLADSLVGYFQSLGGELILDCPVRDLSDLPACSFLFLDVTPAQFFEIAGDAISESQRRRLTSYRYGPASFKMDWALDGPIPWSCPDFGRAPTVHLGGDFDEIAESELLVSRGQLSKSPYVLLAQPSQFDKSRAPEGKHVVWAYCHIPLDSEVDASDLIETQIERFAPGFRRKIVARSILKPKDLEALNENHVGGDINGGSLRMPQLLMRPAPRLIPYKTALPNVYLCSSSTPPGSGVHGMCGYYAAWFARHIGAKDRMAVS